MLDLVADVINRYNPYARAYKNMHEVELASRAQAESEGQPIPNVTMVFRTGPDRQRYNEPTNDEVAFIFTASDGAANVPHDVVVHSRSDNLRSISYLSPNCDPMSYPLFSISPE